jgi:histone H3/H4
MTLSDDDTIEQRKKQISDSIAVFVERIVHEAAGADRVTASFVNALSAVTYEFAFGCVARDLLLFRNHAGRKLLSPDDLLLLTRKAPFHDHIAAYIASIGGKCKQ